MIAMTRIEVWDDGEFLHSKVVPNENVARVYEANEKALGHHTMRFHPRTETERAS